MSGDRKERGAVSFSRSIYKHLLVAYPKRFRWLYGQDMVDVFEDECREQVQSGGQSRLAWLWIRAIADLLGNAALERRRISMSFSVVRWGGLLSVAGGMLLAISGLLTSWLLSGQTWSYVWNIASAGYMLGMLLLAISLTGFVALIAGRGGLSISSVRQDQVQEQLFSIRRITRAQWSTLIGVFLIVVAALSALGLLTLFLLYELVDIGGSPRPYPGDLEEFLYPTFGMLATFGLPLALILLGVAVWRSETLGDWSFLPVGVGVATFLISLTTIVVVHVLWNGYLPPSSFFATFVAVGAPPVTIGIMWTLLGLTVAKSENQDRASNFRMEG